MNRREGARNEGEILKKRKKKRGKKGKNWGRNEHMKKDSKVKNIAN